MYRCEAVITAPASDPYRTSDYNVSVTVRYAPLEITLTAVVRLNQTIVLTCQADALPSPRYLWMLNGKNQTKAVYNTLKLTNVQVNDAGNYTCLAENFFWTQKHNKSCQHAPAVQSLTTGTPKNTVVQGPTVTVTCSANGYPASTITIKRNETVINNVGRFVIPNIQLNEEYTIYTCEPNNTTGTGAKKELKITVQVPPTICGKLPDSKNVKKEDEAVSYLCGAGGKPAPNITWKFKGKYLIDKPPFDISTTVLVSSDKLRTTQSVLTIEQLTWRESGTFSCLAFNDAGQAIQSTELEVEYRPVVQSMADHPKNLTVDEGANATFTCKTKGYPSTQAHMWQFNGSRISGASSSGCHAATFTKPYVKKTDAGWYSCTGRNILGEGPHPAWAYLTRAQR
ncbi:hemicentin-2-like [Stylophora pistillata]|uniref:hemicentin-2-like n=1 Tax=Stylophora pistillata TaxID=50429 RepID=UPI000C04A883|nr:hemicentin-2-like [Stylophora pistillata]